jgi:hypothetical protein
MKGSDHILLAALFFWLSYLILFKGGRDRTVERPRLFRVVYGLVGVAAYVVVLVLPALLLIGFVPGIREARRQGLTPPDLAFAAEMPMAGERFRDFPEVLEKLRGAGDDLSDPRWQEAGRSVVAHIGDDRFGRNVWEAVVEWGRDIAQRRSGGNVSDASAARAALARLAGADDLAERAAPALRRMGDVNFTVLAMLLHVWYPNEDIAYLYFSEKMIHDATADWLLSYGTFLFGLLALALLIQRGMRLTSVTLFGRILGLRQNLLFQHYEEEAFSPWRFLVCSAVVLSISYVLAWHFIPSYCVVFRHTQTTYFAATLWNVLIGSVLVDSLGNLVALVLIRCGIDPARVLWDNVGVAVGSVALLRFFQNSWFTIGTALALGLLQSLLLKAFAWWQRETGV